MRRRLRRGRGRATAAGHPDFEGHWTNDTYTPLSRPRPSARKQFSLPRKPRPSSQSRVDELNAQADDDIHYDDAIWQAENYAKVAHLRTSLIDEPKNGRLPALTARGARNATDAARRATRHVGRQRQESIAGRTLYLVG